jgi:hypothetical protein
LPWLTTRIWNNESPAIRLTEPPSSGFVMPVVTMAPGAPRLKILKLQYRERRLTAVFRARAFRDMEMNPTVENALPAAEGGPTTCIDEH